ncbi:MAG: winged helix-turn-helix domain-containing protein, partial [Candidatus Atribacteria bacterium]|nr:winged helix-turn-helix domain-containing protein [Candidatus Atribacteria bacterium]
MIKKSIADLVYDILEEKNQPMHYRAITEEVMKVKKINAENPHHDVHAIMGSDHRFMKYQRGVWGLVKWKYREANLPYNLTSYCLRNGTIFLTSYLMPYFEWARDDRNAEVIFVATNGEEIKAAINYRQKLIFGFREWFQKMGLEVNDTLFIGLADEEKRKFFIIAEKETKTDLENDLSGYIFQRLREVRKPLIFSEIIESIDSHLIDQDKISEESIQKMLRQDARYVELPKDRWALTEWLNEKNQEYFHLKIAEKVNAFFSYLKNCFDLLGFQTEWNGEIVEEELFVAKALLNYKSYSLVITGLPEDYDISMVQEINWVKLRN